MTLLAFVLFYIGLALRFQYASSLENFVAARLVRLLFLLISRTESLTFNQNKQSCPILDGERDSKVSLFGTNASVFSYMRHTIGDISFFSLPRLAKWHRNLTLESKSRVSILCLGTNSSVVDGQAKDFRASLLMNCLCLSFISMLPFFLICGIR